MSGYLIVIIIMLIMFVALMVRLLQDPVEAPSPAAGAAAPLVVESIDDEVLATPIAETYGDQPIESVFEPNATTIVVEEETVLETIAPMDIQTESVVSISDNARYSFDDVALSPTSPIFVDEVSAEPTPTESSEVTTTETEPTDLEANDQSIGGDDVTKQNS